MMIQRLFCIKEEFCIIWRFGSEASVNDSRLSMFSRHFRSLWLRCRVQLRSSQRLAYQGHVKGLKNGKFDRFSLLSYTCVSTLCIRYKASYCFLVVLLTSQGSQNAEVARMGRSLTSSIRFLSCQIDAYSLLSLSHSKRLQAILGSRGIRCQRDRVSCIAARGRFCRLSSCCDRWKENSGWVLRAYCLIIMLPHNLFGNSNNTFASINVTFTCHWSY